MPFLSIARPFGTLTKTVVAYAIIGMPEELNSGGGVHTQRGLKVILSHTIRLDQTPAQEAYFRAACGCARFVWNWALAEWKRQYLAGEKPNAMALKKQFNAIKYHEFPWIKEIHRDAHAQPFAHLAKAWAKFFSDRKAGNLAYELRFKKKGKSRDSFYVANDKFSIDSQLIKLPRIGAVMMREPLRWEGKVLGATISRTADRWSIAIQVEVPDEKVHLKRTDHGVEGVDLGLTAAATFSTGEKIVAPKPLHAALRRLKIRSRGVSRKVDVAKEEAGVGRNAWLPKGTKLSLSNNCKKSSGRLAKQHARIANLRADFTHKLTTRLCRENQAVVIEDLNVKGMLANDKLARAISDVGFGAIRRQLEYKALRYGTQIVIADRWYPSSRLCSCCGWKNEGMTLKDREWGCQACGAHHDRDINAALNLKRLAPATALPVANWTATDDATRGMVPLVAGKVTPVRYEAGQQGASGQERDCAHIRAIFDSRGYV